MYPGGMASASSQQYGQQQYGFQQQAQHQQQHSQLQHQQAGGGAFGERKGQKRRAMFVPILCAVSTSILLLPSHFVFPCGLRFFVFTCFLFIVCSLVLRIQYPLSSAFSIPCPPHSVSLVLRIQYPLRLFLSPYSLASYISYSLASFFASCSRVSFSRRIRWCWCPFSHCIRLRCLLHHILWRP
jgi:hypothetical protein